MAEYLLLNKYSLARIKFLHNQSTKVSLMAGSERWQMKHSRLSRHRYLWIYLSLMQTASQMFELCPIRNKSENNDFPVVLLFTLCWRDWKLSAFQLSTFPSILRLSARRMSSRVSILFLSSLFLEKALNFELHEKVRKKNKLKRKKESDLQTLKQQLRSKRQSIQVETCFHQGLKKSYDFIG